MNIGIVVSVHVAGVVQHTNIITPPWAWERWYNAQIVSWEVIYYEYFTLDNHLITIIIIFFLIVLCFRFDLYCMEYRIRPSSWKLCGYRHSLQSKMRYYYMSSHMVYSSLITLLLAASTDLLKVFASVRGNVKIRHPDELRRWSLSSWDPNILHSLSGSCVHFDDKKRWATSHAWMLPTWTTTNR